MPFLEQGRPKSNARIWQGDGQDHKPRPNQQRTRNKKTTGSAVASVGLPAPYQDSKYNPHHKENGAAIARPSDRGSALATRRI